MKIALRVDASSQIGTGHFMRCLTLADALKAGGAQVRFVSRHMPEHLRGMLVAKGHEFIPIKSSPSGTSDDLPHAAWLGTSQHADARDSLEALSDQTWDWLVVDHYALDARWESLLRKTVKKVMVIDDIADRQHDCDVLLDQNLYADMDTRYTGNVPQYCRLLLGPRYALLREEFRQLRKHVTPRNGLVKRVLVFFGGVDADNLTGRTIEVLSKLNSEELCVDVVIGAQHPQREAIEAACAQWGFACYVQTSQMAELMAAADLAIGAGGSTSWERCCLGLPTLAFAMANNQRPLLEEASLRGLLYAPRSQFEIATAVDLHFRTLIDNPRLLQSISLRGLEAVDGLGVRRVLREIGCGSIVIREAMEADAEKLLMWRNHSSVRAVSRNANLIDKTTHEAWLKTVLADPARVLLVGECQGKPIGVVRFDMPAEEAEVSVYLDPDHKNEGFGSELLSAAEHWLVGHHPAVLSIRAEVLENNEPSHRLFRAGGYQIQSSLYTKDIHRV